MKIRKSKTTVLLGIIAVVFLSIVLAMILKSFKEETPKKPPVIPVRFVKAVPVKYSDIMTEISGSGRITSTEQINVVSEVSGRILKTAVPLKKGQLFSKGVDLVRIYDADFRLSLLSQKSRFLTSVANLLPDIKIDFPESYSAFEAFFNAIDINKELPALPKLKTDKEKIFLASRNILTDYYSIQSNEVKQKKYIIRAPFVGTYTTVNMQAGSIANPGSVIAEIIRTDSLEIEVPIRYEEAVFIHIGSTAFISDPENEQRIEGRIIRKSRFIDPQTQSVAVFVKLDNRADAPLYKGTYREVTFPDILFRNCMEIPRNAVINDNQVYLVVDGLLESHEINIKKKNHTKVLVSGMPEGGTVVIEPLVNVKQKEKVKIIGTDQQ